MDEPNDYVQPGQPEAANEMLEYVQPTYLDYWTEHAAGANTDIAAKASHNSEQLQLYRDHLLGRGQVVRPHPSVTLTTEARRFYRLLGQHNQLVGAQPDLEKAADIILSPYYRGETLADDMLLEAGSMLVELSRLAGSESQARDYRLLSKDVLEKIISNEQTPWSEPAKIDAAMLRSDIEFDLLHKLYWQSGAIIGGKVHNKKRYETINAAYAQQQAKSIGQFQLAWQAYADLPEKHRQQVEAKQEILGQLLEWAFVIDQRTQAYDMEEPELVRVRHATLRQDEAFDGYSGQTAYLSDNFDVVVDSFTNTGQLKATQKIQLSMAGHGDQGYRHPIREFVLLDTKMDQVYQAIRSEGRIYLSPDSPVQFNADDRQRVRKFREGLVEIH